MKYIPELLKVQYAGACMRSACMFKIPFFTPCTQILYLEPNPFLWINCRISANVKRRSHVIVFCCGGIWQAALNCSMLFLCNCWHVCATQCSTTGFSLPNSTYWGRCVERAGTLILEINNDRNYLSRSQK